MQSVASNSAENKPLENILILDTETAGLDHRICSLLEIGLIVYNLPTKSILLKASGLLPATFNPVRHINNIDIESCKAVKSHFHQSIITTTKQCLVGCNLVLAHNARFDKSFIEADIMLSDHSKSSVWGCTKTDINWPISRLKLQNIAEYYGISYLGAHRALDDCEILLKCLLRLNDFEEQIKNIYNKKKGL